ncbi:hypothetical protein ACFU8W_48715 [Streptomyces sp. NPDC057565]|uniref:hypothetical protein n=1 Tax=Streptomyces sp. NPDC057565 TaxID=3346169 RepID=UPI0036BA165A
MLGFTSEARWLRRARSHLRHFFPCLPKQSGYNKRLRKSADLLRRVTRLLTADTSVCTCAVTSIHRSDAVAGLADLGPHRIGGEAEDIGDQCDGWEGRGCELLSVC